MLNRLQPHTSDHRIQKRYFRYIEILLIYLAFTVIMTLVGYVSFRLIPHAANYAHLNPVKQNWLNVFLRWDAMHYTKIAALGYGVYSPGNYAFFPLYPAMISLLTTVTGIPYAYSGLVISRLCFLGAVLLLYKFAEEEFGEKIALRSVICLMVFPGSFFFLSAYTESVSLLFVICVFFFCRRKNWLFASVFAMLFASLRQVGILIGLIILLEYLRNIDYKVKRIRPDILWLCLIPVGLFSYMIYLYVQKGDPFYFSYCENLFYYRRIQIPGVAFFTSIKSLVQTISDGAYKTLDQIVLLKSYILELSVTLFDFAVIISIFRKLDRRYFIYCILIIVIPFCSGVGSVGLTGMMRYSILLFPIYFVIAKLLDNNKFRLIYVSVGAILNCVLMGLFSCWYWVA